MLLVDFARCVRVNLASRDAPLPLTRCLTDGALGLIEFFACSPLTETVPSEAEASVVVWREEATEPYQILYEMSPREHFVLVFPLERLDIVEHIQSTQAGWRDPGETVRNRFILPAHANTALWLAEVREKYPEFVLSQASEAILDDLLSLPGLDWF